MDYHKLHEENRVLHKALKFQKDYYEEKLKLIFSTLRTILYEMMYSPNITENSRMKMGEDYHMIIKLIKE